MPNFPLKIVHNPKLGSSYSKLNLKKKKKKNRKRRINKRNSGRLTLRAGKSLANREIRC